MFFARLTALLVVLERLHYIQRRMRAEFSREMPYAVNLTAPPQPNSLLREGRIVE
jgi:hypothetical protein